MIRLIDCRSFRSPFYIAALGCFALLACARTASAQSKNDEASALAAEALSNDYARGRYAAARKKLKLALKKCGKSRCSREVRGELYRALGAAYVGEGKPTRARNAFKNAVKVDPSGHLNADLESPEVNAAFLEAGGEVDGGRSREADSEQQGESGQEDSEQAESGQDETGQGDDGSETDDSEDKPAKDVGSSSWLSLNLQQDWLLYSDAQPVCGSREYTCLDGETEYAGPIWPDYGNSVSGGLALATTRVLLGFEHVLGDNFALGVRLGYAFRGGPTLRNNEKFLPMHAELRTTYYFGSDPFAASGVRPYLSLGGGLAEVRSRIDVDFYADAAAYNEARKQTVDGWRNTGRAFIAPAFGSQFAFTPSFALTLELRWMFMLGTSGSAPAASLGFALGL